MHIGPQPRRRARIRKSATAAFVVAATALGYCASSTARPGPAAGAFRVLDWNLRNFPTRPGRTTAPRSRHDDPPHVVADLRATVEALRPDIVALQEIREPDQLGEVLGGEFRWVASRAAGGHQQHLVIGWRRAIFAADGEPIEDEAITLGGALRPALAQRVRPRAGGPPVTLLAVHLKARPSGAHLRRRQWDHLASMVKNLARAGDRLLVIGDFNVTGGTPGGDGLVELRALTQQLGDAGLRPVEVGPCTAYWQGVRHDAWLEPARLDLAFITGFRDFTPHASVEGHCRRHRCTPFKSTAAHPDRSVEGMSDHCPVVIDLPLAPP